MKTTHPAFADAVTHYDQGQPESAAALCHKILAANPLHLDSLRMLGVLARDAGRFDESLDWIARAQRHAPQDPILCFERGTTLYQHGQLDQAVEDYRRASQLNPDFQEAALNLAAILEQQDRFEEALPWAQRAVRLRPTCPKANYNLGNIHRSLGRLQSAVVAYRASLELDPRNAKVHWNLAHTYLLQGDFSRAWPEHEWRQDAGEVLFDRHEQPRWDGSSLAGKTLLVHAEQGVGDEIMFASCYGDLVAQAGHCIFVCDPRLQSLLARSFPAATVCGYQRVRAWVPLEVERHVDLQIPAGSVPLYLRRNAADFPARQRYLWADPQAVERWRQRFAALGSGLKIGISWRAGGRPSERRKRTTGLAEWLPLVGLASVQWINLQYGETIDEIDRARRELGVQIHDFAEGDPLVDLDEFAAKTSALDLVISVGNATVHMAGALGVPAWAVLPPVPGWRWQIAGSTSPWYSSVRLYRQQIGGGWADVFQQLRTDLLATLRASGREPAAIGGALKRASRQPAAPRPPGDELLRGVLDAEQFSAQAVPAALAKALAHHQSGELDRAERIYREILNHLPRNVEAQRLLGLLARQTGRVQLAVSSLRRALSAGDPSLDTSLHLAGSLRDAGRLEEALAAFRDAAGRFPESAEARVGQGKTLAQLYRPDEAIAALREAIRLDAALPEAHQALARLLLDDGLAVEAVAACDAALAIRPDYLLARYTRALALQRLDRLDEAAQTLLAAVAGEPDSLPVLLLLAQLQQEQGRLIEAERTYRRALTIDGRNVLTLNNLGLVLQEQGRSLEARQMYDQALSHDAKFAAARMNRSLACLELGQFREGWHDYHWRWQCPDSARRRDFFAQPLWDGSPLAGRTILVHGEQSIEQEIVLATCLPDLVARAGQVVVTCDPRLASLLARSFPAAKVFGVARGCEHLWRPPANLTIDVQVPAGDLPGHLRPALDHFPQRSDFLLADPLRTAAWRRRLTQLGPGLKVGIAWRVGQTPLDRLRRWAPLGHWHALLNEPRAQFISLQPGDCRQELENCRQAGGSVHEVDAGDDLADVNQRAALVAALDLVIAVGDINLHLAAALGTPAWGLFAPGQKWPWLIQDNRILWYPQVRVFRQQDEGDWSGPFSQLEAEFLNLPASPRRERIEEGAFSA